LAILQLELEQIRRGVRQTATEAGKVRSAPDAVLNRPSAHALLAKLAKRRDLLLESGNTLLIAQLSGVLEPLLEAGDPLLVAVGQALLVARNALLVAVRRGVLDALLEARDALLEARDALLEARDALLEARDALLEARDALLVAVRRGVLDSLQVSLVQTLEPKRNAALPGNALPLKSSAEAQTDVAEAEALDVARRMREAEAVNRKTNLIERFDRLRNAIVEELQSANINLGRCIHVLCLLEGFGNHCGPTHPLGRRILSGRQPRVVVREIGLVLLVLLVVVTALTALVAYERAVSAAHVIEIVRALIAADCC